MSDADDKERILNKVHWFKMVLSVVLGLFFGWFPVVGGAGVVLCLVINAVAAISYAKTLKVEETSLQSSDLAKEAAMDSLAACIVVWTLTYTALWFD